MQSKHTQDVIVLIQGCRLSPRPDESRLMRMAADGLMTSHRLGYTVSYREPENTEVLTMLLVEGERVTMLKSGGQRGQMVFEKGRRYVSYVDTADGTFTVGVTASRVVTDMNESGGRIEMVYGVEVGGDITEENHMQIEIHAASGAWPTVPEGLVVYKDEYLN